MISIKKVQTFVELYAMLELLGCLGYCSFIVWQLLLFICLLFYKQCDLRDIKLKITILVLTRKLPELILETLLKGF